MVGKKLYTYEFTLTQCRVPPFIAKIQLHFKNSLGCRGQQHLKNVFYMSSCYFLFISLNYSYTNTHFSFITDKYYQMATFHVGGSSSGISWCFEDKPIIRDNVEEFSDNDQEDAVPDEVDTEKDTKDVNMSSFFHNFNRQSS